MWVVIKGSGITTTFLVSEKHFGYLLARMFAMASADTLVYILYEFQLGSAVFRDFRAKYKYTGTASICAKLFAFETMKCPTGLFYCFWSSKTKTRAPDQLASHIFLPFNTDQEWRHNTKTTLLVSQHILQNCLLADFKCRRIRVSRLAFCSKFTRPQHS